jgi:hypothetical protein
LTDSHLHAELRTRLDGRVTGSLHHSRMQENVTRPVGELDETEALLRVEPLDYAVNGRPARGRAFARCESGRLLWTLIRPLGIRTTMIVVEAASPTAVAPSVPSRLLVCLVSRRVARRHLE